MRSWRTVSLDRRETRLSEGCYGRCEQCKSPIGPQWLVCFWVQDAPFLHVVMLELYQQPMTELGGLASDGRDGAAIRRLPARRPLTDDAPDAMRRVLFDAAWSLRDHVDEPEVIRSIAFAVLNPQALAGDADERIRTNRSIICSGGPDPLCDTRLPHGRTQAATVGSPACVI